MKSTRIEVKPFPLVTTDTGITNVAKVSFSKHLEDITIEKVKGLLAYLHRNYHWSPFGHARMCFKMDMKHWEQSNFLETAELAGFTFGRIGNDFHMNGSVWAFYENIQHFPPDFHFPIILAVMEQFPLCYGLMFEKTEIANRAKEKSERCIYIGPNPDPVHLTKHNRQLWFVSLHCQTPIYIARQLGKHQVQLCWNEESRRYIDEDPVWFQPDSWRARPNGSIKQGSGEDILPSWQLLHAMTKLELDSLAVYQAMLGENIAPEQARGFLLQSMQIEWIWTGSLKALDRIEDQRGLNTHAQKECKDFAVQARKIVTEQYPAFYAQ